MAFQNAFQSGQQFAVDLALRQEQLDEARRREEGVLALREQYGTGQAFAPDVFTALSADQRADKRFAADQSQRAFSNQLALTREDRIATRQQEQDALAAQDRIQKEQVQATQRLIGFYKAGLANGIPPSEITQRAGPALEQLGVRPDQFEELSQMITTNPAILDEFEGALGQTAGPRKTQGNPIPVRLPNGKQALMQAYTDGSTEILEGVQPVKTLQAQERIGQAGERIALQQPVTQGDIAAEKEAGKQAVTFLNDEHPEVVAALRTHQSSTRQLEILDKGIISGSLATQRVEARRFFEDFLGDTIIGRIAGSLGADNVDQVANTDEFVALAGTAVAQQIQAFGAGTGLSDADREYARQIVGGEITADINAIRRLVRIVRDTSAARVRNYNTRLNSISTTLSPSAKARLPGAVGGAQFKGSTAVETQRFIFNPATGKLETQ